MGVRKLLRQLRVFIPDGFHDPPVLLIGLDASRAVGKGFLSHAQDIFVELPQHMLQHLAAGSLVHDLMEAVVQLSKLLRVALSGMEGGQVDVFLHLLHLLRADILRGPSGAQALQQRTDGIDVLHVLHRDARHVSALIGNDLDQSFELQLPQRLPDGGAADAHLLGDGRLPQFFIFPIASVQDVLPETVEHSAAQGIFIRGLRRLGEHGLFFLHRALLTHGYPHPLPARRPLQG